MQLNGPKTPLKDTNAELRVFTTRSLVAALIIVSLTLALIGRLIQLQIVKHEQFAELSLGNSLRIEPLAPTRGLIFDRNGKVLAENLPAWQMELTLEQSPDLEATLNALLDQGFISSDDLPDINERIDRNQRFKPTVLKSRVSEEEIARFALQRPRFPGVDRKARLIRHYPNGKLGVHVLGYVSGISSNDINNLEDPDNYIATRQFGKTGVEHRYETLLHGKTGYHQILTNAHGRALESIPGRSPQAGDNLHLSIDADLQAVAESELAGRRGAIVALDPRNGQVLAMASSPAFDPNAFATGLRTREFAELRDNLERPLFNRTVLGRYPPGSIIKPILAIAALETHISSLQHRVFCEGSFSLPGSTHRYRDWKPEGHGLVDMHDAIAESCDVFFYELAPELGIDAMHDYLSRFGLGDVTGIDLVGEKPGLVPSRQWKKDNFSRRADQVWFPGETVIASIGQGYLLATPLQMAHATAALGMRGKRFAPQLLLRSENPANGEEQIIQPLELQPVVLQNALHWEAVVNAMRDVLLGANGTARAAGLGASYTMAGKSGTAQVFSVAQEDEYDEETLDVLLRDHALFAAFAPLDEPKIAVAVIIENGSSGSRVAAPVARRLLDQWLEVENSSE